MILSESFNLRGEVAGQAARLVAVQEAGRVVVLEAELAILKAPDKASGPPEELRERSKLTRLLSRNLQDRIMPRNLDRKVLQVHEVANQLGRYPPWAKVPKLTRR